MSISLKERVLGDKTAWANVLYVSRRMRGCLDVGERGVVSYAPWLRDVGVPIFLSDCPGSGQSFAWGERGEVSAIQRKGIAPSERIVP